MIKTVFSSPVFAFILLGASGVLAEEINTTVSPSGGLSLQAQDTDVGKSNDKKPQGGVEKVADATQDQITDPVPKHLSIDAFELPEVNVVGNTPLGTVGIDPNKISSNVQQHDDEEILRHESILLPDFLERRLQNVNVNDVQNNPFQPDITYRGFEASPVLGTPIGISVYQDGVRVNEAFGDIVNWDLIPQVAISNMEMVSGSNPLFGMNTLGGALEVRTKSGFTHPGFYAQSYGGSYGRQNYQAEYGGSDGHFDWYFAGNYFGDGGWRPYSPTAVAQAFSKVGYEDEKTDIDLSFTFADNNMQGVGPTPYNVLFQNWRSIYTAPDITQNTMYFVTLKGSYQLTDKLQVSANTYNRNSYSWNYNSNTNDDCDSTTNGASCQASDGTFVQPGNFASTTTRQNGTGVNLQMTSSYEILDHENQFVVGGGYNYGNTNFKVGSQDAIFYPYMIGNMYETATTPNTITTAINGQNTYGNLFTSDTFSITKWLHANSAMNWQTAQIVNTDQMGTALNGSDFYSRINPSAGLTFNPLNALEIDTPLEDFVSYFNYNQGMRAPTAVELSCANPAAPCTLPSGFVSDPPLKAVVATTLEAGLRTHLGKMLKANFAVYQTNNQNDIQFLNSPGTVINGYFSNVGATRRQGVEFGLSGVVLDSLNWYFSYGYVDATFQSTATLGNSLGAQTVHPGDKIPNIPANTVKFGSEYEIYKDWVFGGDLQYASSQYARGDYANEYPQIPAWTTVNLNTRYRLTKNIELFAFGRNIFDQHYKTFAQMGQNFFQGGQATQFWGPAAPATGYAGVRINF
jgi:iron complex outermembrane recepter protein